MQWFVALLLKEVLLLLDSPLDPEVPSDGSQYVGTDCAVLFLGSRTNLIRFFRG